MGASVYIVRSTLLGCALVLGSAAMAQSTKVSGRITDAKTGRQLNRDFRGKDYATNVLSFPAEWPPGMRSPMLGDLAICAPVVAREAREQGKAVRDHYAHMVIHGTLHLLGYDHIDEAEAERMETLETKLLAGIGIANPYAANV